MGNGSGLLSKGGPLKPHLLTGPGGIAAEINEVRSELGAGIGALCTLTVDEYLSPPPASTTAFMLSTLTSITALVLTGALFTGALGTGPVTLPFPRPMTVTTTDNSGHAGYTGSVVIKGFDVRGLAISDTLVLTNNATTTGVVCFAKVVEIDIPAQPDALGHIAVGFAAALGLTKKIKPRTVSAGAPFYFLFKEVVNGAVVTTGSVASPTTDGPQGAYSPATPASSATGAVVTGSTDATASALYGVSGTLDTQTLILNVNGAGPLTLTLSVAGNALTEAALLAAIMVEWPALTATVVSTHLTLTDLLTGYANTIVVGAGTANTHLGLTAAPTHGVDGNSYAIWYEYDPTVA